MNKINLYTLALNSEHDVVLTRQRARLISNMLGFENQDQIRIATAVSEIARNAIQYGKEGKIEFIVHKSEVLTLEVIISDRGQGIDNLKDVLSGQYKSKTGLGLGLLGIHNLVDDVDISTQKGLGTKISLRKCLNDRLYQLNCKELPEKIEEMVRTAPKSALQEIQHQNQELVLALDELMNRQRDIERLNTELEVTNRGVLALYAELDEKAIALKQASEMKTQFLSNMTHEFRSPLNSILTLTHLLLDPSDGELDTERQKQVHFIRKSAETLYNLVNDLLDLAKIEAGKVTIRPETFDVSFLFASLRGVCRPLVTSPDVNLIFESDENLPEMETDEGKVSQILRNLISNGLKFTKSGFVKVQAQKVDRQHVMFTVQDTGIGISKEHLELIFEEFQQIDNPIQGNLKGTGLGLSLSKKLATLLGGHLSVESELNVGSKFYLKVPFKYEGPEEAFFSVKGEIPKGNLSESSRKGASASILNRDSFEKILIIDDEPVWANSLRSAFDSNKLIEAVNALDGIQKARESKPGLIILDIVLPDLSGFDVLAVLKSDPQTAHIPILVHTSKDLTQDELQRLAKLKTPAVSKNLTLQGKLVERIERLIENRGVHINIWTVDHEQAADQ